MRVDMYKRLSFLIAKKQSHRKTHEVIKVKKY